MANRKINTVIENYDNVRIFCDGDVDKERNKFGVG